MLIICFIYHQYNRYTTIDQLRLNYSQAGYTTKIKLFMAFVTTYNLLPTKLDIILAFLKLMAHSGSRAHSLDSYISVLLSRLFLKSVSCNAKYVTRFKATLTIDNLVNLVAACDRIKHGPVYKAAYLVAFYTFLRILNVLPSTARVVDTTRHILRSDLIFRRPGAHLIINWGKAMESASRHHIVQIPALPSSPICPAAALKSLLSYAPASLNSPLFIIPSPSGSCILMSPMLSATLRWLQLTLKLNPGHYEFHCFRWSGVTWAVNNGVPLQNLKLHGGWSSAATNTYIKATPQASATVPLTFQKLLL